MHSFIYRMGNFICRNQWQFISAEYTSTHTRTAYNFMGPHVYVGGYEVSIWLKHFPEINLNDVDSFTLASSVHSRMPRCARNMNKLGEIATEA